MNYPKYFNPKYSLQLCGHEKNFNLLSSLYIKGKLPKILLLSGLKGSGKSTIVNHFLFSIFDNDNYDKKKFSLLESSNILKQFENNIFQNLLYINGSDFKSIKVDDIRNLKTIIQQSSIVNKDRFIILDDIELFNHNSLNALLKILEEPTKKNFFILINNKTRPLLDTIKSRSLELKVILSEIERVKIINELIKLHNIEINLDPEKSKLSPGNFLKFNHIFNEYKISINDDFLENLNLFLDLYKKEKDFIFINIIFYLSDFYFKSLNEKNIIKRDKIFELKNFVTDNVNKYLTFNINQNSLINAINNKFNNG